MSVYKVAVDIAVTGNFASQLGVMSSQLSGLHKQVAALQSGFSRLGAGISGAMGVAAGTGLLRTLYKIADASKDVSHQLVQIEKMGVGAGPLASVQKEAQRIALAQPGMTQADALKIYGNAFSMFGHEDSMKLMAPMAEYAQVLGNTTGDMKRAFEDTYKMFRSADLAGKMVNPETHKVDLGLFDRYLNAGQRLAKLTHGQVGPAQMLLLAQQGGPGLAHMSEEGIYTMGILAQAMKGDRAGTALMSTFQQFVGGKMTKSTADELRKLGLVGNFDVQRGGHVQFRDGALNTEFIKRTKSDPLAAVQYLKETLEKAGITKMDDQASKLFQLFGRSTTQRMWTDLLRNMPQIEAERGRAYGSMETRQSAKVADEKDVSKAIYNMQSSYQNFLQSLGRSEVVIPILDNVSSAFKSMTAAVQGMDPGTLKKIGEGLTAVGVALTAGGTAALIAAMGPTGWLVGGLTALTVYNWDSIKEGFGGFVKTVTSPELKKSFDAALQPVKDVYRAVMDLPQTISEVPGKVKDALGNIANAFVSEVSALPGKVADAISKAFSDIGAKISAAIRGMIPSFNFQNNPGVDSPKTAPPATAPQNDSRGRWGRQSMFDMTPSGVPRIRQAENDRPPAVPPASPRQSGTQVAGVYLDGQRVGRIVARSMAEGAEITSGPVGFDSLRSTPAIDVG